MRPTLAVALFALVACAAVSEAISTEGFRPGKKHSVLSHHSAHAKTHRHTSLHDLEKDADSTQNDDLVAKMDNSINSVMSDIDSLKADLQNIRSMEETIKQSLSASKVESEESKVPEIKDETNNVSEDVPAASEDVPVSEVAENQVTSGDIVTEAEPEFADVDSFLQIPVDEMNDGMDDDSSPVPSMIADRMMPHRSQLVQTNSVVKADEGKLFGLKGDGSAQTFDIAADGSEIHYPAPAPVPGMVPSNDAASRASDDPSMRAVAVADVDPSSVVKDASMPGTFGKALSLTATGNYTSEDDMVCLCKRRGAPRGHDRVKCKRHPSASPAPSPKPIRVVNIVQCETGVWPQGSGVDAGTKDTVCIYFPNRAPIETPVPTPTPKEDDLPPECYDDRNEFTAEEVQRARVHKNLLDEALVQFGGEVCGCN